MDIAVKTCGLSRPCDIDWANELRPDYVGFVFAPASKRYVDAAHAAELRAGLDDGITAVGVFVDADAEEIAGLVRSGTIDVVQLHGHEDAGYLQTLRQLLGDGVEVIQAFSIVSPDDVAAANASGADYVLLDNGAGGSGESFDWSLLGGVRHPFFLAGGLDADNVGEALRQVEAAGAAPQLVAVDASSGIEKDGTKDFERMRAFVEAVRSYDGRD